MFGKKKVLLIEDDTALVKLLSEKLGKEGFEVITADTGQGGFNKIRADSPNLVLLDIMLPGGMNGFDVLEQVKKDPDLAKIPVIVLTNLETVEKTALDIGAADYIVKTNIALDDLIAKVKTHLQ